MVSSAVRVTPASGEIDQKQGYVVAGAGRDDREIGDVAVGDGGLAAGQPIGGRR